MSWLFALAIAVLGGLWLLGGVDLVRWVYVYSDRSRLPDDGGVGLPRSVLWSPPRPVSEAEPAPDPSGLAPGVGTIVLAREVEGRGRDIFTREFTPRGWSPPCPIDRPLPEGVNSPWDDVDPWLSRDGSWLVFASNRPGGLGGFDLYAAHRGGEGWDEPRNLGESVNSPWDDRGPTLHPQSGLLAFATKRRMSFLLSPPAEWARVDTALWREGATVLAKAHPVGAEPGRWEGAGPLVGVGQGSEDVDPAFSPDGDHLYFSSARAGGLGGLDIYRASVRMEAGDASTIEIASPRNLARPINSANDERRARVFLDGMALVYETSLAGDESALALESRTREVERVAEFASLPLAALWRNAGRIALLLLALVALAVIVLVLYRHRRNLAWSVLARSAAVAVLIHVLMLYGFYFWVVGGEILAFARKPEPEELSVESLLAAKLTVEANRLAVDTLEPRKQDTLSSESRAITSPAEPEATIPLPPTPAERLTPRATPLALPSRAPTLPPAPAVPEPPTVEVTLSERERLPTLEPAPPERESSTEPSLELASVTRAEPTSALRDESPRAEALLAESGPVPTEVPRPTAPALTQVQAPEPSLDILPPVSRPLAPTEFATPLPIPAQAPRADSEAVSAERPILASAVREAGTDAEGEAPRVQLAETASLATPWSATPLGIRPTELSHDPLTIPEASFEPSSRPPPVPGSPTRMPESTPRAETASVAPARASGPEAPASPTSPSRSLVPEASEAAAPLLSRVALAEARPLTATADSLSRVVDAAPARLAPMPAPGAMELASTEAATAPRMPETSSPAARASAGAPEIADLLAPSRARAERSVFRSSSDETPAAALTRTSAIAPPLESEGSPAGLPASSSPASSPPPDLTEAALLASAGTTLLSKRIRLPERPPELESKSDISRVRSTEVRKVMLRDMGGTAKSEEAVDLALQWLARHQSPDGRWDVDGYDAECKGCRSPGYLVDCDAAVTALAVLAFLGQNHHPANDKSPYRRPVVRALEWLLAGQAENGSLAREDERYTMYTHGIATLALSEAYILSRDAKYLESLRRATRLIVAAQNPTTGGWRYKPEPPIRGDTSVTGWQVMALRSAAGAGIEVPERSFERARHWLDHEVASGRHGGIYGYSTPEEPRAAMVAEGLYARLLLGGKRTDRNMEEGARYLHTETRDSAYLNNLYLLYYGNLALYNYQGWIWEQWNREVREFLIRSQAEKGSLRGSWDPSGPWTEGGGRVLSTCFATLALEVYYRYLPLYWREDASSGG